MTHDTSSEPISATTPQQQIVTFLSTLLFAPAVPQLEADPSISHARRGRPQILSHEHLMMAMILAVLHGFSGFAPIWRLITWTGVSGFPLLASFTRAAVRKRLLQMGLAPWQQLLLRLQQAMASCFTPLAPNDLAPFAPHIFALDQCTLDAVRRTCSDVRDVPAGHPSLLVGKIIGLFDLRRQCWHRLLFRDDVFANERSFTDELFLGCPTGSLLLFDLGFFSFSWFDWLTDHRFFWVSRMRQKTSYREAHVFVKQGQTLDALVWLGTWRSDQAKHLVRLIQFEYQGICYQYITNVTDPAHLSMSEVARLYARRWDIELAFKLLKGQLGLAMWWSSHRLLIIQQLIAALIVAQVLHALHLRVAQEAGVDLFDVSLPVLITLLAHATTRPTSESLSSRLLRCGRTQGLLRPSRRYLAVVPILDHPPLPAPPNLIRTRPPHYARHKCQAHSNRECFLPRLFPFFLI